MATQAINVAAGNGTPSVPWAGGVGHLDVYGVFDGDVVAIQYSRDSGTSWATIEDPAKGSAWRISKPEGFNFRLPACDIRAFVVKGNPSLTLAVDAL